MGTKGGGWLVFAGCVGLVACGAPGDHVPPDSGLIDLFVAPPDQMMEGDSGSPGPTATQLPGLLADALCEAKVGCDPLTLYASREQCIAEHVLGRTPDYLDAIEAGWMTVDVEAALACTSRLFSDRCIGGEFGITSTIYELLDGCVGATLGRQEVHEACTAPEHCAPGSYCDRSGTCPGVCTALSPLGGACNRAEQCGGAAACVSGMCRRRALEGESCPDGVCADGLQCRGEPALCVPLAGLGEACLDVGCGPGLVCDTVFGGEGQCVRSGVEGAECTFTSTHCGWDLVCAQSAPGELGSCVRGGAAGDACDAAGPCSFGLTCDTETGTCVGGAVGAFCGVLPRTTCGQGLVCDVQTCRVPAQLGESCADSAIGCIGGQCIEGTCQPLSAENEECLGVFTCQRHLYCDDQLCVVPATNCR